MERRQIVRLWRRGGASVLVTLVRAEGSSYRRPGARLLLGADGAYAGTISGGCLEAEVIRKAGWIVREGAVVERYSTMFDDTAEVPFGLGCGGVVDLLLEPADTPECRALMNATEEALAGRDSVVVTYLPGDGKGLRRVVLRDGVVVFASEGLGEKKLACAAGLRAGEKYEGRFVEEMRGPQRLFVLGAGDDAKPVVSMAALLGWDVTVADGRGHLARVERFPDADRVVALGDSGVSELGIRGADAVVVMTHSYEQDRAMLAALLPVGPRYLGVLGARHRSALLVSEAAAMIGRTIEECCERIYAPVGLDLGGDGPEAIALAMMAEAQAVCMGKLGASRRLTAEDVARQVSEGGVARYLQTQCAL
ncbi:xanthine/CO dehydrogenase XdhC/CoxF family maturation factor [Edaphobacter aggregans]|uniref:Xanthine/CO dehydrogenase XdhC/CoxF family maturation factor n=2 Tax=Edaphobacter aggregans TaxID=570835 RepID=A0A428MFX5_9BACT|nr:xanthine/CO dehydrogenase XdhC/CoxF family maturation factor [Edaphobacter aggregans]